MQGKVLAVNIGKDKGEKKKNIGVGRFIKGLGLADDAHAGPGIRQVSFLARESIEKIRDRGLAVNYGDFAENITTEGIILHLLPVSTELKIGESALVRITQIGKECHQRCNIFYQVGECVMPSEGIFTEVLTGGEVKIGDLIEVAR
ncbi:MAG: MOSC domain-containing protein [Syntrophales bacterium]|nr:MOSC domain-containing protein [Syntrophales bacterium]